MKSLLLAIFLVGVCMSEPLQGPKVARDLSFRSGPSFAKECIHPTNVTESGATIHFVWDNVTDHPHLQWELSVNTENKTIRSISLTSPPLALYLTDLEEWTTYVVQIKADRVFTINNTTHAYTEHVKCISNFTTIPRDLRIDTVYRWGGTMSAFATVQIFDPQKYKLRFECGPIDRLDFPKKWTFQNILGVGVASNTFSYESGIKRMRFVIKSKPSYPFVEVYTSPSIVVYF